MAGINNPDVEALVVDLENTKYLRSVSPTYASDDARTVICRVEDARHNTHFPVILKCIRRGWPDHEEKYVRREVLTHRKAIHPNVICLYEVFLTSSYLCMMCEDGGDKTLKDRIIWNSREQPWERERLARPLFRQMAKAVAYLHALRVVHRLINPTNVAIHNDKVRLLDFGAAKSTNTSLMRTNIGVDGCKAPEVLSGQPYGPQADLFSLGAVLYAMVTGLLPRGGNDSPGAIVNNPEWDGVAQGLSPEVDALLRGLLRPNPATRTTMDQLLVHPWVAEDVQPHVDHVQVTNRNLLCVGQTEEVVKGLIQQARSMG